MSQLRNSTERKLRFSAITKPFAVELALELSLPFVQLALLHVFSALIRPIRCIMASQDQAFKAGGSTKPEPQQSRQQQGPKVRQQNHTPLNHRRSIRVLWLRDVQLRNIVEV